MVPIGMATTMASHNGCDGQIKGGGKTFHDEAANRQLAVNRFPEVTLQGAPQPVEVLHQNRAVEAQFLFQDEADFFIEDFIWRHHHFDRSARQEAKDEENEGSKQQQNGNEAKQAPHGVGQHGVSPGYGRDIQTAAPFYTKLRTRQQPEAGNPARPAIAGYSIGVNVIIGTNPFD